MYIEPKLLLIKINKLRTINIIAYIKYFQYNLKQYIYVQKMSRQQSLLTKNLWFIKKCDIKDHMVSSLKER